MGRSRSRRRRGKSGGVGSSRSKSKSNKSKSKSKSTGGSRGRSSNTRGGQSKANRNQNKKARRTVKSVKKAVSRAAKGIGKSLRGAAANAAGVQGKPKSKLQRQLSNLRSDIAQKSTKEARFNRRADRLKKQFGLDTRDMRNLKLNVNMDTILRQKLKIPGTDIKIGLNDRLRKALPKSIRNFRTDVNLGGKFRSPHKLGVREGYRAPNRGGITRQQLAERVARSSHPEFVHSRREAAGLPSLRTTIDRGIPGRPPRGGPERDWLSELYSTHNISGGKLDQGARDYWSNEAKTKGRDAVMQSIIGTSKAQGTYGGRRKPRRIDAGRTPKAVPPWFKARFAGSGHGYPSKEKRKRERAKRKASPRAGHWGIGIPGHAGDMIRASGRAKSAKRSRDLQNKGAKKRMNKSIAAFMAARGGIG